MTLFAFFYCCTSVSWMWYCNFISCHIFTLKLPWVNLFYFQNSLSTQIFNGNVTFPTVALAGMWCCEFTLDFILIVAVFFSLSSCRESFPLAKQDVVAVSECVSVTPLSAFRETIGGDTNVFNYEIITCTVLYWVRNAWVKWCVWVFLLTTRQRVKWKVLIKPEWSARC